MQEFGGGKEDGRCNQVKSVSILTGMRFKFKYYCFRTATKNPEVFALKLDLASLESVRNFADELSHKFSAVDCLICNAGVVVPMENVRTL